MGGAGGSLNPQGEIMPQITPPQLPSVVDEITDKIRADSRIVLTEEQLEIIAHYIQEFLA